MHFFGARLTLCCPEESLAELASAALPRSLMHTQQQPLSSQSNIIHATWSVLFIHTMRHEHLLLLHALSRCKH